MRTRTATRRSLVLFLYSEVPLTVGALLFALLPTMPRFLVGGMFLSLVLGLPGGLLLLAGRHEFGPDHARSVKRAVAAFMILFALLALAFLQVTDAFPATLRVTDLRAPWVILGLVLAADVAAIHFTLWHLAGAVGRVWVRATWIVGALAFLAYFVLTRPGMEELVARSGGVALNPAEAASYARDFVTHIVRWFAVLLLALRVAFLPALWISLTNVIDAEQQLSEAAAASD